MTNSTRTPMQAFPTGQEYDSYVKKRQRKAKTWHGLFFAATLIGILALAALLLDVINDAFGYVAIRSKVPEAALISSYYQDQGGTAPGFTLAEQPREVLLALLNAQVSTGRLRALEAREPLAQRNTDALAELVRSEIVKPTGAGSWSLLESLTRRAEIAADVAAMPDTELQFRSWINKDFLINPQSSDPYKAGINIAILGSLWVTLIAFLMAVPLGIAAAIYLEEYSNSKSRLDQIIETNINNLAGVPSIIYGMLGLAVFVRFMSTVTSGQWFGYGDPATTNGRTILSAGLTLGLLILPLVIINAREAIRAVPRGLREASFGLGATRWQTIWNHVLPSSMSGILTGIILAVSRAFGETAPLIVVGVSTFIVVRPDGPFAKFTTLTAQIYQWTSRPQEEFQHLAAAAILVLLVLLITLNSAAIYLRTHYAKSKQ